MGAIWRGSCGAGLRREPPHQLPHLHLIPGAVGGHLSVVSARAATDVERERLGSRGLYTLHAASPLKVGDLVAERPPANLARYMAVRRYLPLGVPLLKFVAAIPAQTVCRQGPVITIDGLAVATALASDHANRPLPGWQGCHRLNAHEIFLLNPARPDSFDGRYFGMVPRESVMAKAEALWTESE